MAARKFYKRTGRSIEEVLVQRKLDASDPSSWPDPKAKSVSLTKSLPQLSRSAGQQKVAMAASPRSALIPASVGISSGEEYGVYIDREREEAESLMFATYMALQKRVQELEQAIHNRDVQYRLHRRHKQQQLHQHETERELVLPPPLSLMSSRAKSGLLADGESLEMVSGKTSRVANAQMSDVHPMLNTPLKYIDGSISGLHQIFKPKNKTAEIAMACVRIQSWVRCFLCKRRLKAYARGLLQWRVSRCRLALINIDGLLAEKRRVMAGIAQSTLSQNERLSRKIFLKWMAVAKQFGPVRRAVHAVAGELADKKALEWGRIVFHAFKDVTVGELSKKYVNKERNKLIESIRVSISNKLIRRGELGVVPREEIYKVLYRHVLTKFLEDKKFLLMKRLFFRFKTLRVVAKRFERDARQAWFERRAGACFYAWSDYTYNTRAHVNRKRWHAPRVYELRYSQKRVDAFTKQRALRFAFRPWTVFHKVQLAIKRCFEKHATAFLRKSFDCFVQSVREQRSLKMRTMDMWRGYANMIVERPFHAWRKLIQYQKSHYNEQVHIVNSFLRFRTRQRLQLIVRTWRHQAVFGRVDGMYSRQKLLKSLGDQKMLSTSLQKRIAGLTVSLEECQTQISNEIVKTRELETRLTLTGLDLNRQRMIAHHAQQEINRLGAIIESIAIINPAQIEHLRRLHPEYKDHLGTRHQQGTPHVEAAGTGEESTEQNIHDVNVETAGSEVLSSIGGKLMEGVDVVAGDVDGKDGQQSVVFVDVSSGLVTGGFEAETSKDDDVAAVKAEMTQAEEEQRRREDEHAHKLELLDRVRWLLAKFAKVDHHEHEEVHLPPPEPELGMEVHQPRRRVLAALDADVDMWAFAWDKKPVEASQTPALKHRKTNATPRMTACLTARSTVLSTNRSTIRSPALDSPLTVQSRHKQSFGQGDFNHSHSHSSHSDYDPEDYEEIVEYDTVAAEMLLSVLNFVRTGDLSKFTRADQTEWLIHKGLLPQPSATQTSQGSVASDLPSSIIAAATAEQEALLAAELEAAQAASASVRSLVTWQHALHNIRRTTPGPGAFAHAAQQLPDTNSLLVPLAQVRSKMAEVLRWDAWKMENLPKRMRLKRHRKKAVDDAPLTDDDEYEEEEEEFFLEEEESPRFNAGEIDRFGGVSATAGGLGSMLQASRSKTTESTEDDESED